MPGKVRVKAGVQCVSLVVVKSEEPCWRSEIRETAAEGAISQSTLIGIGKIVLAAPS